MTALDLMPAWEAAERLRLDAARCPDRDCNALPPTHLVTCRRPRMLPAVTERCPHGFIPGSIGWRRLCGCGTEAGRG